MPTNRSPSASSANPSSVFARLLNPLRQAAAAFFKHDLALRRGDKGAVVIVLEQRPAGGAKAKKAPTREELAERKEKAELALIRTQLAELLDTMPETRQAMKHLVFVEQALGKKGLKALHKLPLGVLQAALTQLEGLVTNWSPVGLANLRSKMAVAIIDREHMGTDAEADAYRTAAVLDHEPASQMPATPALPEVEVRSDDEALAAAYAALGDLAPPGVETAVEMQAELGSNSAKAVARDAARPSGQPAVADEIKLRELQS
jgi:hypothetical protein